MLPRASPVGHPAGIDLRVSTGMLAAVSDDISTRLRLVADSLIRRGIAGSAASINLDLDDFDDD